MSVYTPWLYRGHRLIIIQSGPQCTNSIKHTAHWGLVAVNNIIKLSCSSRYFNKAIQHNTRWSIIAYRPDCDYHYNDNLSHTLILVAQVPVLFFPSVVGWPVVSLSDRVNPKSKSKYNNKNLIITVYIAQELWEAVSTCTPSHCCQDCHKVVTLFWQCVTECARNCAKKMKTFRALNFA